MLCILSTNRDPYFNLAAEEYLLRNTESEIFMLWQSAPAVVVGKHQNTLAEINYRFTGEKGIFVARRLTGGGTVYHDSGNINFTFIRHGEPGKLVDFSGFIEPVIRFLRTTGIEVQKGSKHEILSGGKKISGNAEHVYKSRVLHHGTLLFNADMEMLQESIRHQGGTYSDKAVQSNRSIVMNLAEWFRHAVDVEVFKNNFFRFIMEHYEGRNLQLNRKQITGIQKLADEKYRSWDWIYGWSPDYSFRNSWRLDGIVMDIEFSTHRGVINFSNIQCSGKETVKLQNIDTLLKGATHEERQINKVLETAGYRSLIKSGEKWRDLVMAFF